MVQDWFAERARARPEVNMAPGRHTTDAMWRSVVRQEIPDTGAHNVEWNWDLQKATDHVDWSTLWTKVHDAGYPMCALASSLVSYGWGRRFTVDREVSHEIRSGRYCGGVTVCSLRTGGKPGGSRPNGEKVERRTQAAQGWH